MLKNHSESILKIYLFYRLNYIDSSNTGTKWSRLQIERISLPLFYNMQVKLQKRLFSLCMMMEKCGGNIAIQIIYEINQLTTNYFMFRWSKQSPKLLTEINLSSLFYLFILFYFIFLFVVNFGIHWNEKALGSHVFPIPIHLF